MLWRTEVLQYRFNSKSLKQQTIKQQKRFNVSKRMCWAKLQNLFKQDIFYSLVQIILFLLHKDIWSEVWLVLLMWAFILFAVHDPRPGIDCLYFLARVLLFGYLMYKRWLFETVSLLSIWKNSIYEYIKIINNYNIFRFIIPWIKNFFALFWSYERKKLYFFGFNECEFSNTL